MPFSIVRGPKRSIPATFSGEPRGLSLDRIRQQSFERRHKGDRITRILYVGERARQPACGLFVKLCLFSRISYHELTQNSANTQAAIFRVGYSRSAASPFRSGRCAVGELKGMGCSSPPGCRSSSSAGRTRFSTTPERLAAQPAATRRALPRWH